MHVCHERRRYQPTSLSKLINAYTNNQSLTFVFYLYCIRHSPKPTQLNIYQADDSKRDKYLL